MFSFLKINVFFIWKMFEIPIFSDRLWNQFSVSNLMWGRPRMYQCINVPIILQHLCYKNFPWTIFNIKLQLWITCMHLENVDGLLRMFEDACKHMPTFAGTQIQFVPSFFSDLLHTLNLKFVQMSLIIVNGRMVGK